MFIYTMNEKLQNIEYNNNIIKELLLKYIKQEQKYYDLLNNKSNIQKYYKKIYKHNQAFLQELKNEYPKIYKNEIKKTISIKVDYNIIFQYEHKIPIHFFFGSTNQAIEYYANLGRYSAALNFADSKYPGGGYNHGLITQEEDLCRSSVFLYPSLITNEYPFDWKSEIRYTDNVKFLRHDSFGSNKQFNPTDFYNCAIITAAAYNYMGQKLSTKDVLKSKIYYYMAGIINTIYKAPKLIKNIRKPDVLILGAFGSGAFRPTIINDGQSIEDGLNSYGSLVAKLFLNGYKNADIMIGEQPLYEAICFAIPPDPSRNHNNYRDFKQVFLNAAKVDKFIVNDILNI
jgi:uncharacterized protein (TIGR02452 family)